MAQENQPTGPQNVRRLCSGEENPLTSTFSSTLIDTRNLCHAPFKNAMARDHSDNCYNLLTCLRIQRRDINDLFQILRNVMIHVSLTKLIRNTFLWENFENRLKKALLRNHFANLNDLGDGTRVHPQHYRWCVGRTRFDRTTSMISSMMRSTTW